MNISNVTNTFTFTKSHTVKTLSGLQMPRIIYGTAWKKEKTTEYVIQAILTGFRGVDTACQPKHYREDLVGDAIVELYKNHNITRDQIFLQTKFTSLDGQDPKNIPYDKSAKLEDQVNQSLEKSLKNLKTDYIDSYVMHSPMRTFEETMTVWKIFEAFVKSGKVKQIGISNIYSLRELMKIFKTAEIKPAVIQNRFYYQSNYDKGIRNFCSENGIIYQSFWTLTANDYIINSGLVDKLAREKNYTHEQIFFKYVMQLGIVPLIGTTSLNHMKDDLDVLNMEDLTEEEMDGINALLGDDEI
jgi:diketogulonate reductase-like aldo/keto reductase